MLEKIINNIKIQTYTILLSIPGIVAISDGFYNLTKELSMSNFLEGVAGICVLGFTRASYRRQRRRYKELLEIYENHKTNNVFDRYMKTTICQRKVAEVVLKEKNERKYWKKLKEKYPYHKVILKQIR